MNAGEGGFGRRPHKHRRNRKRRLLYSKRCESMKRVFTPARKSKGSTEANVCSSRSLDDTGAEWLAKPSVGAVRLRLSDVDLP